MKEKLNQIVKESLSKLKADGILPGEIEPNIIITPSKDKSHGDFATNCALTLTKIAKLPPRELAQKIQEALPPTDFIRKTEIAGPGFINFYLDDASFQQIIPAVLQQGAAFGINTAKEKKKIHIEYVSANPTGPLHVGHGRGAAYGASVANLLTAVGHDVHREYYVNDLGRQMQVLALSVWIRYLQLHEETVTLPRKAYQGDYVTTMAEALTQKYGSRFHHTLESVQALLVDKDDEETDPEKFLDTMVTAAKQILTNDFELIFDYALQTMQGDIHNDLEEFGVTYDEWFRESRLAEKKLLTQSIDLLKEQGFTYEKDGALWFRATQFDDDKDRVLVRSNGNTTYFASDVAYHLYKYNQGYDEIIDVFGADHHGYIPRIRAFLQGLKKDPNKVKTLVVQFAILYRDKEKVSMSTRAGEFVTLRELRHEVGNDAARFFYILRKPEQHLDFDLDLAKSKTNENPVYYIQYAHARICSVYRQMQAEDLEWNKELGLKYLSLLTTPHEKELMNALLRYSDVLNKAADNHEPHTFAYYLLELATTFHGYYNAEKFLVPQPSLRNARLCLINAVKQIFVNGLLLLGISAPNEM